MVHIYRETRLGAWRYAVVTFSSEAPSFPCSVRHTVFGVLESQFGVS